MRDFNFYLKEIGEIGFVEEVVHSIVHASGLPQAHPGEVVMFESGDLGQILFLKQDQVEVLLLSKEPVRVGMRVVRTGEFIRVPVGTTLLGRVVDPLTSSLDHGGAIFSGEKRFIDSRPFGILERREVNKALETGVTIVDLVVPLARGQRELVIGDRKTGKTDFILQVLRSQARQGTICIYALIGQKQAEIRKLDTFFQTQKIKERTILVATSSADASGLIFLTPYTAMTIAEYFRDQGQDVLVIFDDMTTHARCYREISLLAQRFPGKNSYPGDIFFAQARLVERAGNFAKAAITCLPVAESVLGDLSGYIQTNLMAMTDGHVFFDVGLYNEGKRPAVSPFLSVTRVGHQVQTPLQKDVSRELTSFLVTYERMKQFMHFGAETGQATRDILSLGERVDVFLDQSPDTLMSLSANIIILSLLWAGVWNEMELPDLKKEMQAFITAYEKDQVFKKKVDTTILAYQSFIDLVTFMRRNYEELLELMQQKQQA